MRIFLGDFVVKRNEIPNKAAIQVTFYGNRRHKTYPFSAAQPSDFIRLAVPDDAGQLRAAGRNKTASGGILRGFCGVAA